MKKLPMVLGFGMISALTGAALACGGQGKAGFGKQADTNQDGKVTLAEAVQSSKDRFQKKDSNKDGVLSGDEVQGRMQHMLANADTNKDGKLTAAEHEAKVREHFTARDANKNGVLEGDELRFGHGKKDGQGKA